MRNSCTSQVGASQIYTWSCLCKAALLLLLGRGRFPQQGCLAVGTGTHSAMATGGAGSWEGGFPAPPKALKPLDGPQCVPSSHASCAGSSCCSLLTPPAVPHCWACLFLPDAHLECTPCCPSRGEETRKKVNQFLIMPCLLSFRANSAHTKVTHPIKRNTY